MDANPYVGPRAYSAGENVQLYGRDRELTDLLGLLVAQRIALLYSPSGAGKTSLIESRLVPELEQLRFHVFPRVRVGLEQSPIPSENRYLASVLLSLGEETPPKSRDVRQDFRSFFQSDLPTRPAGSVLIFDQFEEILTLNPADTAAKEEFFSEIGRLLTNRKLWALFVLREEYAGALEPYLSLIPTRLASRYRLDLLSPETARDAIRGPTEERGVEFCNEAVDLLVEDLRKTKQMDYEGAATEVPGPVVEPVYLQVVCHRLWEALEKRGFARDQRNRPIITLEDVKQTGDVAAALRGYYADVVSQVSLATGADERRIRQWVGNQLITGSRFRNQVMRQGRRTHGLDEKLISKLSDSYLLRTERRPGRGVVWYELAHDRLVDPVLEDNSEWFASNPSELERLADFWNHHGQNKALLLRGEDLDEMLHKLGKAPELTAAEEEYLFASKAADEKAMKRRKLRRLQVSSGLGVVSILATFFTFATVNLSWKNTSLQEKNDTLSAQRLSLISTQNFLGTQVRGQSQIRDTILMYAQAALVGPNAERADAAQRLLDIIAATDLAREPVPLTAGSPGPMTPVNDSGPTITYFSRPTDQAIVEAALQPLGYKINRQVATAPPRSATNQVLYGLKVPVEDARRVALALVSAGVPIKRVALFRTTRYLHSNQIQVLYAPQLDSMPALPVDSIRVLSRTRPRVGPPLTESPPPVQDTLPPAVPVAVPPVVRPGTIQTDSQGSGNPSEVLSSP